MAKNNKNKPNIPPNTTGFLIIKLTYSKKLYPSINRFKYIIINDKDKLHKYIPIKNIIILST